MQTTTIRQSRKTQMKPSSRVQSLVRRLAVGSALVVPAFAAPMLVGVSPALAACVNTGGTVVCAADDTDGFTSGVDITDLTVNNGVTVSDGAADAVDINGSITGTLLNNGIISATGGGFDAVAIDTTLNRLINNGTISGADDGVRAGVAITSLINNGTISTQVGDGVNTSTLTSLTNSGIISGGQHGVAAASITSLTNSGTISGADEGLIALTLTSLTNSGTISGGDDGIRSNGITSLTNSGTISANLAGNRLAILEGGAGVDTTLTLNAGSVLIGRVDLGGGTNTLNIGEGLSLNSTFESEGGVTLVGLGSVSGHLVALIPVTGNGNNDVQIVAVDPSAFASMDDALAALTSGIGQTVQGRQAALRSDPALGFASRFAAAEETSLAAFSDLDLDDAPHLNPNRFWIEGFGAYRQDDSGRVGGDFDHLTGGLVAGVDVPLDALTSVGVMAGFAASTSENETNTQETDTMSYYAGVYASTQALGLAWDASLTVGYSDYDQERITANNLVAGGLETASADFGGWFINPQVTMTREAANPLAGSALGNLVATNTFEQSLTLAYAGLWLDGYTETGTTNPLTLNDRDVHIASARAALALPFERIDADGALTTLRLIGGVEARTQFGDDGVSGTLLGQTVTTTLDDDDATFGGFLGLSAEHQTTTGLTAYANAEALVETSSAWQISATAGLRIAF